MSDNPEPSDSPSSSEDLRMPNDNADFSGDPRAHKDVKMFDVVTNSSIDNSTNRALDDSVNVMEDDSSNGVEKDMAGILVFLARIEDAERNPPTTLFRRPIYSPVTSIRPRHKVRPTTLTPVRLADVAPKPSAFNFPLCRFSGRAAAVVPATRCPKCGNDCGESWSHPTCGNTKMS